MPLLTSITGTCVVNRCSVCKQSAEAYMSEAADRLQFIRRRMDSVDDHSVRQQLSIRTCSQRSALWYKRIDCTVSPKGWRTRHCWRTWEKLRWGRETNNKTFCGGLDKVVQTFYDRSVCCEWSIICELLNTGMFVLYIQDLFIICLVNNVK